MERILQENTLATMMIAGILIMLTFALAFVLFANHSQKKILREKMHSQEKDFKHQENLLHSNLMTQEEERRRIARDLHDEIGSKLNVILLNIYRLKGIGKENTEVLEITDEAESIINKTIDSTRRISHELLPPTLEEFGLVEAIRELQFNFNQLGILCVDFNVIDHDGSVDDKMVELNLYRVLQELVNNSIRHGKAGEIAIDLWVAKSALKLNYTDDGVGFDKAKVENNKGLGMKNIESRLDMIKANYDYQTALGNGVQMNIELTNT
jgi:signal transduction histidine kinase